MRFTIVRNTLGVLLVCCILLSTYWYSWVDNKEIVLKWFSKFVNAPKVSPQQIPSTQKYKSTKKDKVTKPFKTKTQRRNTPPKALEAAKTGKLPLIASNAPSNYTIYTKGCQIPYMDPLHPSIIRYVSYPTKPKCRGGTSITYNDGEWLRLNKTIMKHTYEDNISHCAYWPVYRAEGDDHTFRLGSLWKNFSSGFRCNDDVIKVACYDKAKVQVYTNIHMFIHVKKDVEKRCNKAFVDHVAKSNTADKLSVLLVGMDSTSRSNTVRHLRKTRAYIEKHFEPFEMLGYNKAGSNTYECMVPFLSGKYDTELPYPYPGGDGYFDRYNFIWKEYSARGYRVQYVDENPYGALFQYVRKGFRSPPADYYAVGVLDTLKRVSEKSDGHDFCVGDRIRMKMLIDAGLDFARMFRNKPYFSYVYTTVLTHDDINNIEYADAIYLNYLTKAREENLLNNTVLMMFGDHGMRYGGLRNTFVGKLEACTPWMLMLFPKWFLDKYPYVRKNLRINTGRFTTAFDMYDTLQDILHFNGREDNNYSVRGRSLSLFHEVPENRTCFQAQIAMNWCSCKRTSPVSVKNRGVLGAAAMVVRRINKNLYRVRDLCVLLNFSRVHRAEIIEGFDQIEGEDKKTTVYQLVVGTSPNNAKFDVTVRHNLTDNAFEIMDRTAITRIDKYGKQSSCIKDTQLREFCYCISLLKKKGT